MNKDSRENECQERWGFFSKFKVYDYFHCTLSIFMTFSAFTNRYNNLFSSWRGKGSLGLLLNQTSPKANSDHLLFPDILYRRHHHHDDHHYQHHDQKQMVITLWRQVEQMAWRQGRSRDECDSGALREASHINECDSGALSRNIQNCVTWRVLDLIGEI